VKIAAPWGAADGWEGLKRMQQCIEQTRLALGDEMELMVDCYMSWDREFSARLAERVRDCDVKWFEDPLPNGWAEPLNAELRRRISLIQVAIGNLEFDYKAYYSILSRRACDITQPELTAVRRIAAMARPYDIPVVPHGSGIYNYHFVISNVNSPYAEYLTVGNGTKVRPIFDAVVGEALPENGHVKLNRKPGFGVELNPGYLIPFADSAGKE
jgi:L-rhamnonate dehydratase